MKLKLGKVDCRCVALANFVGIARHVISLLVHGTPMRQHNTGIVIPLEVEFSYSLPYYTGDSKVCFYNNCQRRHGVVQ